MPLGQIPVTKDATGVASGAVDPIARSAVQPGADVSPNPVTATGFGGSGSTLALRFGASINVKADFLAKGDNSTNDTTALQSAINKAATLLYSTYWNPVLQAGVYLPPGVYNVTGIDIPAGVSLYGDGPNQVTINLIGGSNRSTIRFLADAQTDPVAWAQHMHGRLANLTVNGNGNGQTAATCNSSGLCHGVEFQDAPYAQTTRYSTTAYIDHVHIFGSYQDDLYVGANRNFGIVNGLLAQYTNVGHAVEFKSSGDWLASNVSVGDAAGDGVKVAYGNNNSFNNLDSYGNGGQGLDVISAGGFTTVNGGQFAGNQKCGVYYNPGSGAGENALQLNNLQIGNNSLAANAGSSQVCAQNFESLNLSNVFFIYAGGNNAQYLVNADATGVVSVGGLTYNTTAGTTAGNAPYTAAPFSGTTRVVGDTAVVKGQFTEFNAINILSANQYDGFTVKNGSNVIAQMTGSASGTNDGGVLTFWNAGTKQINFSATGQSSIGQGLTVNGNLSVSGTFRMTMRQITTGATDTTNQYQGIIAWNSATSGAKSETIAACSSSISGMLLTIKDEAGTAGTNAITVTPASGTIDGASSASISTNKGALRLACDGGSNWLVN